MAMGSFSAISIVFNVDAYKVIITVPLVGLCSKCCRYFGYISFDANGKWAGKTCAPITVDVL